jgi:hypothetical protein
MYLKVCSDCGQQKMIGRSKSRCRSCRHLGPPSHPTNPSRSNKRKRIRLTLGPFTEWLAPHLPKCVYPQNNEYSTMSLGKTQRNFVLKAYGYKNYATYLQSSLWMSIRARVLEEAACICGCGKAANQVHHKTYTEANLLGETLHGLVPINNNCHYTIEFSDDCKVSLGDANRVLKDRRSQNG